MTTNAFPQFPQIALIDDDISFTQTLQLKLQKDFRTVVYHTSQEALRGLKSNRPAAILLDVDLAKLDGQGLFQEIRKYHPDLMVFFLSLDNQIATISKALELGGSDYFCKSISAEELICRMKSRMKYLTSMTSPHSDVLTCRELRLDLRSKQLWVAGEHILLSPKEYDIMKIFMERQDELLSKPELLTLLWEDVHVNANNIDTHMFHLRKKFGTATVVIETRKGLGYILRSRF